MDNIEWIFSGIGIFILSSITYFIRNKKIKTEEKIDKAVEIYCSILEGKISGHAGIPGLIRSGLASFKKQNHIKKVIEKVTLLGHPNPIPKYVYNYIQEDELLDFIKWQAKLEIKGNNYFNEKTFSKLAEQFQNEKHK